MARPSEPIDGFWLPAHLTPLREKARWETQCYSRGSPVAGSEAGPQIDRGTGSEGVCVRWPVFSGQEWKRLLAGLKAARDSTSGSQTLERWQKAFEKLPGKLMDRAAMVESISQYTGYPSEMFLKAFGETSIVRIDEIARTLGNPPAWASARSWQPMAGDLPGMIRFFPHRFRDRWDFPSKNNKPIHRPASPVGLGVGFAAGNVPGNGLIVTLLLHIANHLNVGGGKSGAVDAVPPVVVVRNSRQAPILAPWVLSAIEEEDPELVAGIAMLVWDYDDEGIQETLLREADLVMAAASDRTIEEISGQLRACRSAARFHAHGHKVSFDIVDWVALQISPDKLTRLSALDSTFWDQYGCLSARIHFVEKGGRFSPGDYAEALTGEMRVLSREMPRGVSPLRYLHRSCETYKLLESSENVKVFSDYDDDFLVVCDGREWNDYLFRETVNRCTGRVVVVREVEHIEEVPARYLKRISPANLQTVGVAVGKHRVLELAEAAGSCGVTALRCLGRSAFPRLAYSWDGFLPLDLGNLRPFGYFTTLETADPLERVL